MREPYRTLLGHMRHESGHYYWECLIQGQPPLDEFRRLFGDDRLDYATALGTYHQQGAPADWQARFVSAYASAHPWEDWAETWAHYFHMVDTLETAVDTLETEVPDTETGTVEVEPEAEALRHACPNGIDGYFENVGGAILDAVMSQANAFSRIAMCGMISGYNGEPIPMAAPQLILLNRMKVQGFIVSEHMPLWPQALSELGQRVANGTLKYRETVAQGLESAPEAFIGLLKGRNFGKQLVKLV